MTRLDFFALTLAAAAAAVVPAAPAVAQASDFQWRGTVAQGRTIEIRGVNGAIQALPSDDASVRVEATRQGRRSDPESVRIEVIEHGGGVTICAVYPTPASARRENECRPGGGQNSVQNNDVRVEFVVRVPAGVRFEGNTVNGNVKAESLHSDVKATTVNGSVEIRTEGFAQANTVNGSITCRVGQARLTSDVKFETVNGNIVLEMPAGLNAEFRASTVNGRIDSDFPIMVTGQISRRSLRGTIGDGGPELRVSTVNGSVRLRQI
jgi:tRNA threonylcarbamoyladenosine modification (KEOPS) complex  Pcc1 subunit